MKTLLLISALLISTSAFAGYSVVLVSQYGQVIATYSSMSSCNSAAQNNTFYKEIYCTTRED